MIRRLIILLLIVGCGTEPEDCAGVAGGDSVLSGCDNACNSTAVEDMCGTCDSNSLNDCVQDCAGTWGGSLVDDECGVCDGNNTTCMDECGVPNGDNSSCSDECGVPYGDNSTCLDCAGVPNGLSVYDNCGEYCMIFVMFEGAPESSCSQYCDADPTNDCVEDCAGIWGGDLVDDECGVCGGDNSSCADCNGEPNGTNWVSDCGCVPDYNSGDDCDDCAGVPDGDSWVSDCG